jgi:hypothetical protein
VVRRNFPWAVVRSAGDVHAHAGPQVGTRGHVWEPGTSRCATGHCSVYGSTRSAATERTTRGDKPDNYDTGQSGARYDEPSRNQAVAES